MTPATEPGLPEKVVALHHALEGASVAHAFGGALALAYYAEPRATVDVDVNVFVGPEQAEVVTDALTPLGVEPADVALIRRDGQVRTWWGRNPVDLFFAYDAFHHRMDEWAALVPFGEERVRVLAPEHLLVCKAVFDRSKDWIDIDQMLVGVPDLDAGEVRTWLARLVGGDDQRWQRVDRALREHLGR